MRVCSFLPSATEILYELGLGDALVGVTHECDFPPQARTKRVIVNTSLPASLSAAEIDRRVNEFMARGESLYFVDAEALREIQPDLIITQDLCRVCAASPGDLGVSLAVMPRVPEVLSLNPHDLPSVWNDVRAVGKATGRDQEAAELARSLERRVAEVEQAVTGADRPRVLCLEWLDPPFIAGHWVPDMVARAGGEDVLGKTGEPGFRITWQEVFESQPDVVVVMPCGYHLPQVVEEFRGMNFPTEWNDLPAVRSQRVFAVDATSYFSRPGPRLAAGVEILARLIHPDLAPVLPPPNSMEWLKG